MQPGSLFPLVTLALLAGCNSPQKLQQRAPAMPVPSVSVSRNVQPVSPDIYAQAAPEVVRYDRYLLVSTAPQAAQRDPLSQVIDIRIPASL
ncbi:pilus assembly protein PilL, partial [Escherichia marmotae]|nr:pilus assembly protein PilL [Escherichia marmotae]